MNDLLADCENFVEAFSVVSQPSFRVAISQLVWKMCIYRLQQITTADSEESSGTVVS